MKSGLKAGVSTRDITPGQEGLFELMGIPRLETTRGVLHRLRVEALVLACGDDLLWIVTCDQLFMQECLTDPVRERVAKELGLEQAWMIFGATHCHSSEYKKPDPMTIELQRAWDANAQQLEDAFVEACLEAHSRLAPAEIATSTAVLREPISHCRRMLQANGSCLEHWVGSSLALPGEKRMGLAAPDPDCIQLIAVRALGESHPFALLTSFPSHVHLIPLPFISDEVSGAAKREIERRHPEMTALYALGAAGDTAMNPTKPPPPGGDLSQEQTWYEDQLGILGGRFSDAIDEALETLAYERPEQLRFAEYDSEEPRETMLDFQPRGGVFIQAAALGRAALLNIQGELFHEYGRAILAGSPYPDVVTVAYHERGYSYIGTELSYEEGSYEIKGTIPRSEEEEKRLHDMGVLVIPAHRPIAGKMIADHSLELLQELADRNTK